MPRPDPFRVTAAATGWRLSAHAALRARRRRIPLGALRACLPRPVAAWPLPRSHQACYGAGWLAIVDPAARVVVPLLRLSPPRVGRRRAAAAGGVARRKEVPMIRWLRATWHRWIRRSGAASAPVSPVSADGSWDYTIRV